MKRLNWLMMLLAAGTLAFTACEKNKIDTTPDDTEQPGNDEQPGDEELTLQIKRGEVTMTSVTYSITPSDLEADYFVVAFDATAVQQCETDEDIVTMVYDDMKGYAESVDTTFEALMEDKINRGMLVDEVIEGLSPGVSYYLIAFGVDAANGYAATNEVALSLFTTKEPEVSACTFTLKVDTYLNTAAIKVTPSDNAQQWSLVNVDVDTFNSYTSADGEYQWTNEQFFEYYVKTQMDNLKAEGLSDDEIRTKLVFTGHRTVYAGELKAKTKYVCFAAGVTFEDDSVWASTVLKEIRYNAGEADTSNLTFDIDVFNIDHYSAEVVITPSNPDAEYYYYISYIDSPKKDLKPIDIANNAVHEYIYYWEDYTELKRRDPVKGVVELTGENSVKLDIAETEYYIVAFSFEPNPTYGTVINEETGEYDQNPGTITSAPVYVSFMTSEQGDPMTAEFAFTASEVGPYDFVLEIDASDPTIYYQPGVALAEGFDPQVIINESASLLAQVLEMCMTGQSPSLTVQEALEEKCSHLYRNGDGAYYIANLTPEKEYIGYVLTIDTKTRKFARCAYSEVIAKTCAPGSVTPTVELLGVYKGDDENGTIFGKADLTAGRPIVAVKHTNVEGATALYSALSTDVYDEVVTLSNQYIIANFRGYWQEVNLTVPYHFFVAEWDADQTVVSYALDANGNEAGVGCLAVKPVTFGDIEELRGYVEEVNAATPAPQAYAKSLVVAESSEPVMNCIWSESVGAPRAAKVTHHAIEPLETKNDIVEVKVIKTFRY